MISESQRVEFSNVLHSDIGIISNITGSYVGSAAKYIRLGFCLSDGVVCDNDCGMMVKLNVSAIEGSDRFNMVYIPLIKKIVCVSCHVKMIREGA